MIYLGIPNKHKKFVRYTSNQNVSNFLHEMMNQKNYPKVGFDIHPTYKKGKIEIMFDDRYVTPEMIEKYFSDSKISIKRESPFYFRLHPLNKVANILLLPIQPIFLFFFFVVDKIFRRSK